ncbi:SGNH/GDSL hydrolase family protein [Stakelama tenebrarum]|nr:SGNH/GDSL hydrolase family protein [Sphingosinithalassobacter tenebrarum]
MINQSEMHWIGTWATTPDPMEGVPLADQTVRMIARTSIGGAQVRVRLSNAYGAHDLAIGAARVGLRADGADVVPGTNRPLTFNGSPSTTIAAGALVVSDPVELDVPALADLAVSVYLPDDLDEGFRLTGHSNAHQTNYISPRGDRTAETALAVEATTEAFVFVSGVEVLAPRDAGGLVAFGDSLTEGNLSQLDANHRWPDQLARRLVDRGTRPFGVVNQGIGGNRLLHDFRGDNALRRFDRDVLAQPGVTHVIVLIGINDLRNGLGKSEEEVDARAMIGGLNQLITRARTAGLKIFGGTLLTWENETFRGGAYTPAREAERQAVNAWIRESGAFDAVIDFEAALRDPDHPMRMLPQWDYGDHLHPNDAGYLRMGDCIDLALFD